MRTKQLIGNKVTEKDIRGWLDDNGYYGRSARFEELELYAISRPGWKQIFRFRVAAKAHDHAEGEDQAVIPPNWQTLHGLVVDDERKKTHQTRTKIEIFDSEASRGAALEQCSTGMITCKPAQNGSLAAILMVFIGIVAICYFVNQFF